MNKESFDYLFNRTSKISNLAVFRKYLENYLKENRYIHKKSGFTFLIRQLQPASHGIPIEIYIFTNDTNWISYEEIQSEIFDHIISTLYVFKLKMFQLSLNTDKKNF
jgi:miniconductance mechanosensitive channel